MSKRKRTYKVSSPSLSIGGRHLTQRTEAPLTNASSQLSVEAVLMLGYAYALSFLLLRAMALPVNPVALVLILAATFICCLAFLKFRKTVLSAILIIAVLIAAGLLWPDGWLIHLIGKPIQNLIVSFNSWFYKMFYHVNDAAGDYSGISAVFTVLTGFFLFTWINLSSAPFAMGLLASIAYGLCEVFDKGAHDAENKIHFLLAILVVLRFLAERKPSRSAYPTLRQMADRKLKLSSGDASRRNMAAITALLLLSFIVILDSALPSGFFHNQWLDDSISRIVGRKYGAGNKPIGYKEFSLKDFGYYPLETKLGGKAVPSLTPFLTIDTDGRPLWLKGSSYRLYTGEGWASEPMNPNWLFGHRANQEPQGKFIGVPQTADNAFMRLALRNTHYTIHPEQDQQVVFQGGRPSSFERFSTDRTFSAYFNKTGQLYLDNLIPEGGYTGFGQSFNALHLQTAEELTLFNESYDIPYSRTQNLTKEEQSYYLELPRLHLEPVVRTFDQTLHRYIYNRVNAISDAEVIAMIRDTLSSRLSYSLDVGSPETGEEFVGWFLREGKGYCSFFATAVTVLAREAGIPARYVEGFLVPATKPGERTTQTLTGANAHAWSEVWLNPAGWVPVDATPPGALEEMAGADYSNQRDQETEKTEPPPTEPEPVYPSESVLSTDPEPDPDMTHDNETAGRTVSGSIFQWLLYFLPLWIFLGWRYYIYRIRHSEKYIERALRRLGAAELVRRIATDIFTLWELDGKKRDESETVRSFILRVEISRYTMFPPEFIYFLERALYAPEGASVVRGEESLRKLTDFYREEEVHLKKTLERKRWILRRWLTSKRQPF